MQFAQILRSDPEKVFAQIRNVSGATISAGIPVEWEVEAITDGNSVTAAKSGSLAGLFAGVSDAALVDDAYGLIQVYGYRTSAYASAASGGSAPGTFLSPVSGIFQDATLSAATTSGHTMAVLMETSAVSTTAQYRIFVRAM